MIREKVWIVSEVFYPDETSTAYIMTAIALELGPHADVHVLCGPAGYGKISGDESKLENLTIHRIDAFNFSKNNIFTRLLRILFISLGMFIFALFKVKKNERLFLVTNPALSIPLFALLKKIKCFSLMILVHDVFPENLIPAKIIKSKKNIIYRLLRHTFNVSYRKADKLFVLGRDMREVMVSKNIAKDKITIIENWADLQNISIAPFLTNDIIVKNQLQDKIVFTFAGNLGRVQGLDFFFQIISAVNNKLLHFLFVGDGAMMPELQEIKIQKQLENVTFLGVMPRNQQEIFLNASHFGVVTLEDEVLGLGVPSKSYNIMAAGKPIFFIGNQSSEVACMIREHNCGITFSPEQMTDIVDFMENLTFDNIKTYTSMSNIVRQIAEKNYSKASVLRKFKHEIIDAF